MKIPTITAFVTAAVAVASAAESISRAFTWTGPITKGGSNITLVGPIESILTQMQALNGTLPSASDDTAALVAMQKDFRYDCSVGKTWGWASPTWQGLMYLRGLGGMCGLQANDVGGCGRVSCSWETGISFCNDRSTAVSKPCSDLAAMVLPVYYRCRLEPPEGPGVKFAKGAAWDDDDGTHIQVEGGFAC